MNMYLYFLFSTLCAIVAFILGAWWGVSHVREGYEEALSKIRGVLQ